MSLEINYNLFVTLIIDIHNHLFKRANALLTVALRLVLLDHDFKHLLILKIVSNYALKHAICKHFFSWNAFNRVKVLKEFLFPASLTHFVCEKADYEVNAHS